MTMALPSLADATGTYALVALGMLVFVICFIGWLECREDSRDGH